MMQIIRRPAQIRLLGFLYFLVNPLALLNFWIVKKGHIKSLIDLNNLPALAAVFLWVLITMRWILLARWRGFWAAALTTTVLLWTNVYLLSQTKNYALAFYALFLLTLSIIFFVNLYKSLIESYFNSGRRWFEGLPEFLPKVLAEIQMENATMPSRISRLSVGGCFLYPNSKKVQSEQLKKVDRIELKLNGMSLKCNVQLITLTKDGIGAGFRFVSDSPDQDKDIRDFIDQARSLGYVP